MPGGADALDAYDAACAVLAYLHERYSQTGFTLNDKGGDEVLNLWLPGAARAGNPDAPVVSQNPEQEAEDLKRQMAERAAAKAAKANG